MKISEMINRRSVIHVPTRYSNIVDSLQGLELKLASIASRLELQEEENVVPQLVELQANLFGGHGLDV